MMAILCVSLFLGALVGLLVFIMNSDDNEHAAKVGRWVYLVCTISFLIVVFHCVNIW